MSASLTRLYLVSPPALSAETLDSFATQLESALESADVAAFLLRLETASDQRILAAARMLTPLARARDCAFLIHERADLAVQADADGVHVTGDAEACLAARKVLGKERTVGAGAGLSRHAAMAAAEAGADYVAFGSHSRAPLYASKFVREAEASAWCAELLQVPAVLMTTQADVPESELAHVRAEFFAPAPDFWHDDDGVGVALARIARALAKREEAA